MILDEILRKNSTFSPPAAVSRGVEQKIAILTCVDSRLVDFLESSMGLQRGDAAVIKNAGNHVTDDVLRSLAVLLFSFEIREILVIGHTDCVATNIKAYDFTESMKKQGVSRDAIPSGDLRGWLGASSSERERVRESVQALRRSPLIPREVLIHGLLFDIAKGSLEVVVRGSEKDASRVSVSSSPAKPHSILDRAVEWITKDEKPSAQKQPAEASQKNEPWDHSDDWLRKEEQPSSMQSSVKEEDSKSILSRSVDWLKREEQPFSMQSVVKSEDAKSIMSQSVDWLKREVQPSSMQSSPASEKIEFQMSSREKKDEKKAESYDWGISFEPGAVKSLEKEKEIQSAIPPPSAKEPLRTASLPKAAETQFGIPPQADLASRAEKSMESFEVWLEDYGLFGDDVKKELRRITGTTVDDIRSLQQAVMSTKSPQEAQRIKRALQSLGARAIIKRVRKIIRQ
ncbi:MAG: beta-class carbonic anhydrase [Candidatus Xenobiia bacterium LiM19]